MAIDYAKILKQNKSILTPTPAQPPVDVAAPEEPSWYNPLEIGKGIVKGAASTVLGASELGQKLFNPYYWTGNDFARRTVEETGAMKEQVQPTNAAQSLGFGAEQIGEFFVPGMVGVKGAKALKVLSGSEKAVAASKYIPRLAQILTEATPQLLVSAAHEGEITPSNVASSAVGGAFSTVGKIPQIALGAAQTGRGIYDISEGDTAAGITNLGFGALGFYGGMKSKGLFLDQPLSQALSRAKQVSGEVLTNPIPAYSGNWLQKWGKKIMVSNIKPTGADMDSGFDANNIAKYNVGGALDKAYGAVSQRIAGYATKLRRIKDEYGDPMVIDFRKALADTQAELLGSGKNFRQSDLKSSLGRLENELGTFSPSWKDRKQTFFEGTLAKSAAGEEAAFHHDPLKSGTETVGEQVYNSFYRNLNKQLAENAPKEYASVNKALSELIPIRNALLRRLPIAERNNVVSILDLISAGSTALNPKAAPLFLLVRAAKSGRLADIMMKLGKQEQPDIIGNIPKRTEYPLLTEGKTIFGEAPQQSRPLVGEVISSGYDPQQSANIIRYGQQGAGRKLLGAPEAIPQPPMSQATREEMFRRGQLPSQTKAPHDSQSPFSQVEQGQRNESLNIPTQTQPE